MTVSDDDIIVAIVYRLGWNDMSHVFCATGAPPVQFALDDVRRELGVSKGRVWRALKEKAEF